jgi:hypothetical protein
MNNTKTAKGRLIDMAALARVNEDVRAVSPGNERLNGRGDRVDASGNVLQTVQAKATIQHNTSHAPEKRKLSDAPTAPTKTAIKKPDTMDIVREETKTRDDGSTYIEVEYTDGSMDVTETGTGT